MTKLATIPNTASDFIKLAYPWEHVEEKHYTDFATKREYKAYVNASDSESCHFFPVLGANKLNRPKSKGNPPAWLVCISCDYDSAISDEDREKFTARLKIKPTWLSRSYSGGTHAVWMLESPLPIISLDALKMIKLAAMKDLNLKNAYGTLDEGNYLNPCSCVHCGWEWREVGDTLSEAKAASWLNASMKAVTKLEQVAIPLDEVKRKIELEFPNRWVGDFELGSRGVRFWDSDAQNDTAAVVSEKGMLCYTGGIPFMSWGAIFGEEFIEEYNYKRFSELLGKCYAVGDYYYYRTNVLRADGSYSRAWQRYSPATFSLIIADHFSLSTRCEEGNKMSEVNSAAALVRARRSVSDAAPFIYELAELRDLGSNTYLNTSTVKVFPPDLTKTEADFPFIAGFLKSLFPEDEQRERFISEFAYTYQNAHAGKPRNGRVLFIAGDKGVGKNFLTEVIYARALGGFMDASSYLLGETRFNEPLFTTGVWVMNDVVSRGSHQQKAHFSQRLKQMAANFTHTVEGKFKNAVAVPWSGRVLVTLNTDAQSMGILPELDINNRDKVSLYKVSGDPLNDPDAAKKAESEMGAFCAYLLNYQFPEHCQGCARWGVNGYLHPELLDTAEEGGATSTFEELLTMYLEFSFEHSDLATLEVTGTELHSAMLAYEGLGELVRAYTPRGFATQLGMLSNRGNFPISKQRVQNKRVWTIKKADWLTYKNE